MRTEIVRYVRDHGPVSVPDCLARLRSQGVRMSTALSELELDGCTAARYLPQDFCAALVSLIQSGEIVADIRRPSVTARAGVKVMAIATLRVPSSAQAIRVIPDWRLGWPEGMQA